eukprot:3848893-Lingulodinium_polyedra.AAC.1
MACAWPAHGLCVACAWPVHGLRIACAWGYAWAEHVLCTGRTFDGCHRTRRTFGGSGDNTVTGPVE